MYSYERFYDHFVIKENDNILCHVDTEAEAKKTIFELKSENIDFSKEDFSEYDFMYAINRLHMQFHDIIYNLADYVAMAERYFKDSHCPHDPSEKAYREAHELLKKHKKV